MDLRYVEDFEKEINEALRNKKQLKRTLQVLKEELLNVERLRNNINDHVSSCQSLTADLESKINEAKEIYKIQMDKLSITTKKIDKLESVHHQVKSVLQDRMVITDETVSKMSMLHDPSLQCGLDLLTKKFGIHPSDEIEQSNWNINSDENDIKQFRNRMHTKRSQEFYFQFTAEDFSVEKLLAVPPFRRSPVVNAASHENVTSSETAGGLIVPKTEYVSPRAGTGISPSTSTDLRPKKTLFVRRLDLKENISPKTPMRSPVIPSLHKWKNTVFMVGLTCLVCSDLITYSSKLVQCTKCKRNAHEICKELALSCIPDRDKTRSAKPKTPKSASKSYCVGKLKDLVAMNSPKVPSFIVSCVSEIEARGIDEVNLYKEYVPEKQVISLIKEKLKVKGRLKLFDVSVHVLCGCLKEFFRRLDEPLVSRNKLNELSEIINKGHEKTKCDELIKSIQGLEQANMDTLVFVILHLQRIVSKTKITVTDISKLFGPYIFGCSRDDTENIPLDTKSTSEIMAELLSLSTNGLAKVLSTADTMNTPDVSVKPKFRFFNTPKSSKTGVLHF